MRGAGNARKKQRGTTLVEVIVYAVIIAVAMTATVSALSRSTAASHLPAEQRAGMEIASALLDEIMDMPFSWCDPDDDAFDAALSAADCSVAQGEGPTPGETRGGAQPFDTVWDYHGFSMAPPTTPDGFQMPTVAEGWSARVSVSKTEAAPDGGTALSEASGDFVRIEVSATSPSGKEWTLTGYRARRAPNAR